MNFTEEIGFQPEIGACAVQKVHLNCYIIKKTQVERTFDLCYVNNDFVLILF